MLLSSLHVEVKDFASAESYLESCDFTLDCLITDVDLPGMSGLQLLQLLRARGIPEPVILLGAEADVNSAVIAMREGAVDFIEKPNEDFAVLRRVAHLVDAYKGVSHQPVKRSGRAH